METGDQLDRWHMSTLNGKQNKMASVQATEGLAPGNGAGEGYWIDELDNWSFLEYWVSAKAIAWRPLPEPFAGSVLGYNRKELQNERHAKSRAFVLKDRKSSKISMSCGKV